MTYFLERERSEFSEAGLMEHKRWRRLIIRHGLYYAHQELYYKELGARPYLTEKQSFIVEVLSMLLLLLLTPLLFVSPFMLLAVPPILPIALSAPKIIGYFIKKRFMKKSAAKQQDIELRTELYKLVDTYYRDNDIEPWTVHAIATGDNEAQLFDIHSHRSAPVHKLWTMRLPIKGIKDIKKARAAQMLSRIRAEWTEPLLKTVENSNEIDQIDSSVRAAIKSNP